MRILNRPMFRYGGPIKEGVMDGIREPKRNGGSMTQRVQPSNDGSRPGYAGPATPFIPMIMAAGRAGLRYIPKGINALKNLARKQSGTTTVPKAGPTFTMPGKTVYKGAYSGKVPGRTIGPGTAEVPNYVPNFVGSDPTVKLVGGIYKGITSPTATGIVQKGGKLVFSPTGVVTGLYLGGKYYNKDGKETKKPKGSTIGGKKPGENSDMYYKEPEKELTEAEKAKIESDNRIKQMDKYREIMDIKGMSKDAAYKSLIDAGKIIQEGGNLKEQLKSGKLIQNLTQAASKRFDKVGDTEAALRSLIVKGEIDKEMNKDTKALDKEYKEGVIAMNKKKLAGANLSEELSAYRTKNNKNASGKTLAGFVMDKGGEIVSIADSAAVDKHIKGGGDSVSFMELIVAKNIEAGKEIIPGMYVVKDSLVTINPDGSVTPNYKIS